MFNLISRDHILSQLHAHFSSLTPYFRSMYNTPNTCYYCMKPTSGVPLNSPRVPWVACSPACCLGLHPVLQRFQLTLNSLSPLPFPSQLTYMDDVSSVLHPSLVTPYLTQFIGRRILHRCYPQLWQNNYPIYLRFIYSKPTPALQAALSLLFFLPHSHLQHGTCVLGFPLGSAAFISACLQQAAATFQPHVHCIMNGVASLQVPYWLFRFCAQTALPHLLATLTCGRLPLTVLGATPWLHNIYLIRLFVPLYPSSQQSDVRLSSPSHFLARFLQHYTWFPHGLFATSQRPGGV